MAIKLDKDFFKAHYDKILAGVVLVALLISLIYLSINAAGGSQWKDNYFHNISRLRPEHPDVESENTEPYEQLLVAITSRHTRVVGPSTLFIPEARLECPKCLKPISLDTVVCPCGYAPPPPREVVKNPDADGDGMLDEWEVEHGLNPLEAADAILDNDGDGFINIEEFLAGTDPAGPTSHPPYRDTLILVRIEEIPLNVLFLGRTRDTAGVYEFQLRVAGESGTVFAKVGDTLPNDLKIEGHEVRRQLVERRGMPPMELDVDYLLLLKGDVKIELALRVESEYREFLAHLTDRLDHGSYKVAPDETFEFRGAQYRLISVNAKDETVELMDSEGVRFSVGKKIE